MPPQAKETDALVLNCTEHGESDMIVTLFSLDRGRLNAIAKGAKRSKRRFVNKLELFSFLRISYQQKENGSLAFLAEAELHTSFLQLRRELPAYAAASVIREFLLLGVKENEPELQIFRLSLWALHHLDRGFAPMAVLALFLVRFFDHLGYRPDLQVCAHCNTPVASDRGYQFNAQSGRLTCSACRVTAQPAISLSHGTIKILGSAQDQPLDRLHRLKISGSILQEAVLLLQGYGNQLFQREIVSWSLARKFLQK